MANQELKAPAIDVQVNGVRTKAAAPGNLVGEALSSIYQGLIQLVNAVNTLRAQVAGLISGQIVVPERYAAVPYVTPWTPDFGQARRLKMTLTGPVDILAPLNVNAGFEYEIMIIQDSTGGRFVKMDAAFKLSPGMTASVQPDTVTNWIWRADGAVLRCTSYTAAKPV